MAKTLMRTIEYWRVDSEAEAQEVIENATAAGGDLTKKIIEVKQKKSKGEIIQENLKVTAQVDYCGQFDEVVE